MNVEVVYIHPVGYDHYAERFVASYLQHPPLVEHHTTVVCNGEPPSLQMRGLFSILPEVHYIEHDNSGWDIGGYQAAARQSSSDIIVFFGATSFVCSDGWLLRMITAFQNHGKAQYGCMANRGNKDCKVWPHLRTTGFWTSPELFNRYPIHVTQPEQRYPFEHGENCFSEWCKRQGLRNWLVTTTGDWMVESYPSEVDREIRTQLLSGDRLVDSVFWPK
jgi:hypothetical protein